MGNSASRNKSKTLHKTLPKKNLTPQIRSSVWLHYFGNSNTGGCYCCGKLIKRYKGWHCSHVIAKAKGGSNTLENLRPCCAHCNLSMGNQNMYAYIQNKNLKGPGAKNVNFYFKQNKSQIGDRRTNNWKK